MPTRIVDIEDFLYPRIRHASVARSFDHSSRIEQDLHLRGDDLFQFSKIYTFDLKLTFVGLITTSIFMENTGAFEIRIGVFLNGLSAKK